MDDAPAANLLAEENTRLQAQLAERDQLLAQQQAAIAALTQQRDDYYLNRSSFPR